MTMLLLTAPAPLVLLPATVPARRIEVDVITHSDALTFLKSLPSNSVNCVMTSPPYFGLRDYGVPGQWGLEATPAEHVARIVALFREVKRALRDDGVLWLNYGDSYSGSSNSGGANVSRVDGGDPYRIEGLPDKNTGLQQKNLIGMPWRVAFGLQDDGWILRSDVIWAKPNPMPESVTDRPTKSHEYVFLFSKSGRYWYDQEAVREANTPDMQFRASHGHTRGGRPEGLDASRHDRERMRDLDRITITANGRNLRTVWNIATEPTPFAHFATFPQKLVERCILAGCPRDGVVLDPFMGSGTVALVARRLGRHYVGSELNPEYVKLCNERLSAAYTLPLPLGI